MERVNELQEALADVRRKVAVQLAEAQTERENIVRDSIAAESTLLEVPPDDDSRTRLDDIQEQDGVETPTPDSEMDDPKSKSMEWDDDTGEWRHRGFEDPDGRSLVVTALTADDLGTGDNQYLVEVWHNEKNLAGDGVPRLMYATLNFDDGGDTDVLVKAWTTTGMTSQYLGTNNLQGILRVGPYLEKTYTAGAASGAANVNAADIVTISLKADPGGGGGVLPAVLAQYHVLTSIDGATWESNWARWH